MKGAKTGGREKGTPNRLTKELRSALKNILHDEIEKLPEHLATLDAKDRIELLVKIMPFVLPRVEVIKATANEPDEFDWNSI